MTRRVRFVRPKTVTLPISDGDSLIVRQRLTAGEQRAAFARIYMLASDGRMKVNPIESGLGLVLAYLVDWTLVDEQGAIVPIRDLSADQLAAVLNDLSPEDFSEIKAAIEAHDQRIQAERTSEKKPQDGESALSATSSSPNDSAGVTNGSIS